MTDGPFAETKDLIAGWMVIDVDSYERAIELAGELSAAPGAGGEPIHEWLEVRPFLAAPPTVHRSDRGRRRATRARPTGLERPRPSRCRLRDGRGRRAGGAHPGALRVGGRVARRPHGVAHHGRVESLPRHDAVRRRAPRPRGPIRHRTAGRRDPERRRHAAPLLPVRAPRSDVVVGGRVDPPSRGWPHHTPDRSGLPRARAHHGAAHQPRQAHRSVGPASIVPATCAR